MSEGSLSWSMVREVTRVANAETEQPWLDLALAGTAAHIERLDLELAIWILANQSTVSSRKSEAEAA